MPLLRGGRMLKRWRYVGVYGPELMLCVGDARVGPARQLWWAVWDRGERRLLERTRLLPGRGVARLHEPGHARVDDGGVSIDLRFEEAGGVEVVSPHGSAYIWTRKQLVAATGTVRVDGRALEVDGPAIVDDSAGYHARRTSWRWSAGVGSAADGRAVAWNLVEGVHDAAQASERTVWVEGQPREVGTVRFASDLGAVEFEDGGELRFTEEASRARRDNLVLLRSRYRQPFGTFAGSLPGVPELAQGYGVMEHHEAVW